VNISDVILEGLRRIAKQQKGETTTIYGKRMVRVEAEPDNCVYVLLERNVDLNQLKGLPPGDTARRALAFATLLKLKKQKLIFFEGTPRWGVWVAVEGTAKKVASL